MNLVRKYGWAGVLYLSYCVCMTRLRFPRARLIRFPFDVRRRERFSFGKSFTTGRNCRVEVESPNGEICIGDNFQMNDYCHISALKSVTIGDNVLVASRVFISDLNHGNYSGAIAQDSPEIPPADRPLYAMPIVIEDNVWLGEGVCVLAGARIGRGAIIGANAVVTGEIPAYSIALGAPARVKKKYNKLTGVWETV